jgi:hypothetical protein
MDNMLAISNQLAARNVDAVGTSPVRQVRRAALYAAVALILLPVFGCGGTPFELAEVKGTVTIDGKPFTQGKVMFAPVSGGQGLDTGKPAYGRIQPDGSFVLGTYSDNDGAVVGEHWATIIAGADPAAPVPAKFRRLAVPTRFKIEPGKVNQIDIKLTQQDVAKRGTK